ncbi:unnamed protein product [Brugia pahangi]|uniref:PTB domain-containing protein n=1 Tax=Brugia pahangi TaxID=6280 RepID=A0A0N4TK93_BRUPA|nr:unnamed protein product [Brugia pahangi]
MWSVGEVWSGKLRVGSAQISRGGRIQRLVEPDSKWCASFRRHWDLIFMIYEGKELTKPELKPQLYITEQDKFCFAVKYCSPEVSSVVSTPVTCGLLVLRKRANNAACLDAIHSQNSEIQQLANQRTQNIIFTAIDIKSLPDARVSFDIHEISSGFESEE